MRAGVPMHALLVQDVFTIGERVRAMLIGMDEGFQRISLSTAELEATPGDMLYSKVCACLCSRTAVITLMIRQSSTDIAYYAALKDELYFSRLC